MTEKDLPDHLHRQVDYFGINEQNQPGLSQAIETATFCLCNLGLQDTKYIDPSTSALVVGACMAFKKMVPYTKMYAISGLLRFPNFQDNQIISFRPPVPPTPITSPTPYQQAIYMNKNSRLAQFNRNLPTHTINNLTKGRYLNREQIDKILTTTPINLSSLDTEKFIEKEGSPGYYQGGQIYLPNDFDPLVLRHEFTHAMGTVSFAYQGVERYENLTAVDELTTEALCTQYVIGKKCSDLTKFNGYDWLRRIFINNTPRLPLDALVKQFTSGEKYSLGSQDTKDFTHTLIDQFEENNLARLFQLFRLSLNNSSFPPGLAIPVNEWGKGKIYW